MHNPVYADRWWNFTGYGVDALSTGEFQALVDAAILSKSVFMPYWHVLAAASFQTEIEYIKSQVDLGKCVTMTMSEYWTWCQQRFSGRWQTKVA